MNSKTEEIMALDSNALANTVLEEITDIEAMEHVLSMELSSAELFRIDSAILSSLRNTTDFSRNLLEELENGKLETLMVKPKQNIETELMNIQKDIMLDITTPLNKMFDDITIPVCDALLNI